MTSNNNITSSIEVVVPQESIQEIKQEREAVTHYLSNHPFFQPLNRLHPHGRMYKGLDKNGSVIGAAISPYYHEFQNQVDPEIAAIIMALRAKGYLTVSSCAGHPMRSHITMCFPSIEARAVVRGLLEGANIKTAYLTESDHYCNVDWEEGKDGEHVFTANNDVDRSLPMYRRAEAKSLNQMFFRAYDEYQFLTLHMFTDWSRYLNPIKYYKAKQALPRKTEIFNELEAFIQSERFPYNPN
jgi:hypothetical protein